MKFHLLLVTAVGMAARPERPYFHDGKFTTLGEDTLSHAEEREVRLRG